MSLKVAEDIEWEAAADDEAWPDGSLGPEDYAWLAFVGGDGKPEQLPQLPWIWDRRDDLRLERLIGLAARRPLGSA